MEGTIHIKVCGTTTAIDTSLRDVTPWGKCALLLSVADALEMSGKEIMLFAMFAEDARKKLKQEKIQVDGDALELIMKEDDEDVDQD